MKHIILLLILVMSPLFLSAQDPGFMGMNIGMAREQVLAVAEAQPMIEVPKNRDVEFFPVEDRKILTLSVRPEVPFIYLQFYNDKLYAITVIFDDKYMDYHTLSASLQEKYGKYASLQPGWRQWQLDDISIKVEKPAVVKYIALEEFLEVSGFEESREQPGQSKREALLNGL